MTITGIIYCAPSTQSQLPKKMICAHPPPPHRLFTAAITLPPKKTIGKIHASRIKNKGSHKAAGIYKNGGIYKGAPHTPTVPQLEGYFANRYWHHWRNVFFFCFFFFTPLTLASWLSNYGEVSEWCSEWVHTQGKQISQPRFCDLKLGSSPKGRNLSL